MTEEEIAKLHERLDNDTDYQIFEQIDALCSLALLGLKVGALRTALRAVTQAQDLETAWYEADVALRFPWIESVK